MFNSQVAVEHLRGSPDLKSKLFLNQSDFEI